MHSQSKGSFLANRYSNEDDNVATAQALVIGQDCEWPYFTYLRNHLLCVGEFYEQMADLLHNPSRYLILETILRIFI